MSSLDSESTLSNDNNSSFIYVNEAQAKEKFFEYISNENLSGCFQILDNPHYKVWEFRDEDNFSPLHHAAYLNNLNFAIRLINVAKKNTSNEDFVSFINAKSKKGYTALLYASYRGNIKLIKLLIENSADIYCKNNSGLNVVHMAAQGNQPTSLYYFLCKYHFDFNSIDRTGSTPLHWACYYNSEKVIRFILCIDSENVNAQNNDGFTPLHLAIMCGNLKSIKKLLLRGADISIENNDHKSAVDIAKTSNNVNISEFFTQTKKFASLSLSIYTEVAFYLLHILVPICIYYFIFDDVAFSFFRNLYVFIVVILGILFIVNWRTDPGVMKKKLNESLIKLVEFSDVDISNYCPVCEIKHTKTSKHCYVCNHCVNDFDHHCIWIGKCITKKNISLFFMIIFVLVVNFVTTIIVTVISELERRNTAKDIVSFIIIFGCLFGIFAAYPQVRYWYHYSYVDNGVVNVQIEPQVEEIRLDKVDVNERLVDSKKHSKGDAYISIKDNNV